MQPPRLTPELFERFLYRQHVRKLDQSDGQAARQWCLGLIRREHPDWDEPRVLKFYEDLINVRFYVVDEWSRRMS